MKTRASMTNNASLLRLRLRSAFDSLDLVQVVSDHVAVLSGLDEDGVHWLGVAVRESVINAIKHGNRLDLAKHVEVEFAFQGSASPPELVVSVTDEGEGFDPEEIGDPLAPENILKSSGRGIFFMKSFMDDVVIRRRAAGGMEVRLVKQLPDLPAFLRRA
jgi:serine/threonine-protein kinase RsbW